MAVPRKEKQSSVARNQAHGRAGCGPAKSSTCEIPQVFRIATLNVGTMRGTSSEVVETVSRRGVQTCAAFRRCGGEGAWRE